MKNRIVRCAFLGIFFCTAYVRGASWTVLLYEESDATLNDAVFKNIFDLMRAQSNDSVTIAVQLHCWGTTAWRFMVKDHALIRDSQSTLSLQPAADLIDGARWAFEKYPADHYMLVLGSHGFGILDPVWSEDANNWVVEVSEDMSESCPLKSGDAFLPLRAGHRGVLFYPPNIAHTYLTNRDMVVALSTIVTDILHGKKIDILGMDACRMAMIEIAYQIAPFVNYLIGTQDCELVDGWDYYAVANFLAEGNKEPRDVAAAEVFSYDAYYNENAPKGFYTQSAIDCGKVAAIASNLDAHIACIGNHLADAPSLKEALRVARKQQPSFCQMPSYVDLMNFYMLLKHAVASYGGAEDLIVLLDEGISLVQQAVVANVTGARSTHAHGISIYFPRVYKESSYAHCAFGEQTHWCQFLADYFNGAEEQLSF